jgi:hypothetical protein
MHAAVQTWLEETRRVGVKTIFCLLEASQLDDYPFDLIDTYARAGFSVLHHPVPDRQRPAVPEGLLQQLRFDWHTCRRPVVVHCWDGLDRTQAVVDCLSAAALPASLARITASMQAYASARGTAHFELVTDLALRLFDQVKHRAQVKHGPGVAAAIRGCDRTLLWAAAMLHDIGTHPDLAGEPGSHGQCSAEAVLHQQLGIDELGITPREIASVAGLHRTNDRDEAFVATLWPQGIPKPLRLLAAILRVADGCDYSLGQETADIHLVDDRLRLSVRLDHRVNPRGFAESRERAHAKDGWLRALAGVGVDPDGP